VPEVCTAVCVALATLPERYHQAGIRAVIDRLTHVTSRPSYKPDTDRELALCVARLPHSDPHPRSRASPTTSPPNGLLTASTRRLAVITAARSPP
jgi:hypothetical protein